MKMHNSEKSIQSRVSDVALEGRRMLRSSAHKAGEVAGEVARRGRRIVGTTVHQTEIMTKRHPWVGLGTAATTGICVGACLGALVTWLFRRD